jgi:hypothetical protein
MRGSASGPYDEIRRSSTSADAQPMASLIKKAAKLQSQQGSYMKRRDFVKVTGLAAAGRVQ